MFLVDKYRPNKLQDSSFHKNIYNLLENISRDDNLPHIIFYGPEGSGKSTMINIFLTLIFDEDIVKNIRYVEYFVNASNNKPKKEKIMQSDHHIVIEPTNTNYDKYLIHDIVKEYSLRKSLGIFKTNRKFKIVNINNIDNMSYYAQTSLRRTMEQQTEICRFIMSCKTLCKIIKPLRSRCICIRVPSPDTYDIFTYLLEICVKEFMYDKLLLMHDISTRCNGNIKTALWDLEFIKNKEENKTDYSTGILTIVNLLIECKLSNIKLIRKIINNLMITTINCSVILSDIVFKLCDSTYLDNDVKSKIIEVSAITSHGLLKSRRKILQFDMFINCVNDIINDYKTIKNKKN